MYKNKSKQREANAERQRRYKARQKGVTSEGVTCKALPIDKTPYAELIGDKICNIPKRGKDIKTFEDLPPDVRATIVKMSTTEGELDEAEKAKRTTAAIKYQHHFPDQYYGTRLERAYMIGEAVRLN